MIDAHRGAFEYEWRARFQLPLTAIGRSMSWGEAYRITTMLANDPTSHVAAAISGWDHPVSFEALALMNLFDLTHQIAWRQGGSKGPRPTPYPRPWRNRTTKRAKPDASLTQDEIIAALRRAGHTAPIPVRPPV